jgi:hypothetical protein
MRFPSQIILLLRRCYHASRDRTFRQLGEKTKSGRTHMEGLSLRPASVSGGRGGLRAERLGSNLGVVSAVFYFLPFVVTVLVIVGGAIDPGDFREVTTQQSKLIIQKS